MLTTIRADDPNEIVDFEATNREMAAPLGVDSRDGRTIICHLSNLHCQLGNWLVMPCRPQYLQFRDYLRCP
jgi:hypothetical protein